MATYFLDTSAIIKRYFAEQGHAWVVSLYDPTRGHYLNISQAALVEVVATMCRKTREQSITIAEHDMLINAFRQDSQIFIASRLSTRLCIHLRVICAVHIDYVPTMQCNSFAHSVCVRKL